MYILLFSHFIACGVWEAIYILDGLIRNRSSVKPTTVHADTQGQNLPVFGLASLLGVELMPRIRNWKDLTFYRPTSTTHYTHIESLFGDQVVDPDALAGSVAHGYFDPGRQSAAIDALAETDDLQQKKSSLSGVLRAGDGRAHDYLLQKRLT